ncbi:MAG: hypothetical protein M3442_18000 [Chloroflexota bacterium]|nr:hypothetical protein [Chloroflexota bacterium]
MSSQIGQTLICSKIIRDWSNGSRPLSAADLNLGNFQPGPGMTARLVMPHSVRSWDAEVPVVLARAVVSADAWQLDFTGRPAVMQKLAAEIDAALTVLKQGA